MNLFNFLALAQLLTLGYTTTLSPHSSYNDYFFEQEQIVLEKDLHDLESRTFSHEPYALGMNHESRDWLPRMFTVSRVATTLIKGLKPSLTVQDVRNIGQSLGWIKADLESSYYTYPNQVWLFHFLWKNVDLTSANAEPDIVKDWRKLTNRALLWKTRCDNWQSLLPIEVRQFSSASALAEQRFLDDLFQLLEIKLQELYSKSLDFSTDTNWVYVVFSASSAAKQLLVYSHPNINVQEYSVLVQSLGWALTQRTLSTPEFIWNFEISSCTKHIQIPLLRQFSQTKQAVAIEFLQSWAKLTNLVFDWKFRSVRHFQGE